MRPVAHVLAKRGLVYHGVLYAGLMMNEAGPHVLEFNVRFGDPECQALMLAMSSDLLPALIATTKDDPPPSCTAATAGGSHMCHYGSARLS